MTYLTVRQTSELLNIHPNTIRSWIKKGIIPVIQAKPYGKILINSKDIDGLRKYQA